MPPGYCCAIAGRGRGLVRRRFAAPLPPRAAVNREEAGGRLGAWPCCARGRALSLGVASGCRSSGTAKPRPFESAADTRSRKPLCRALSRPAGASRDRDRRGLAARRTVAAAVAVAGTVGHRRRGGHHVRRFQGHRCLRGGGRTGGARRSRAAGDRAGGTARAGGRGGGGPAACRSAGRSGRHAAHDSPRPTTGSRTASGSTSIRRARGSCARFWRRRGSSRCARRGWADGRRSANGCGFGSTIRKGRRGRGRRRPPPPRFARSPSP